MGNSQHTDSGADTSSSFEERIALDQPQELNVRDFRSYKRMAVARGNTLLRNIFKRTETPLPKLVASVRWAILRQPLVRFALHAGISPNGYKAMEMDQMPAQRPHRDKYTRLIDYWKQSGISAGIREQLLHLLDDRQDLYGFYNRMGYELGHERIEDHFPSLYNTLWQRQKSGTVPKFLEVHENVDALYPNDAKEEDAMRRSMRLKEAQNIWSHERRMQWEARGVEPVRGCC